jgi:hypothetical protein
MSYNHGTSEILEFLEEKGATVFETLVKEEHPGV